jgi:hypothetical protein
VGTIKRLKKQEEIDLEKKKAFEEENCRLNRYYRGEGG